MATMDRTISACPPFYGTVLQNGSQGPDVAQVQTWLNGVRGKWPQIIELNVDGKYGSNVTKAVKQFQTLDALQSDGKVGENTWSSLYQTYAELHGAGEVYCGISARSGARGAVVESMQKKLNAVSKIYTAIQTISADGRFGTNTSAALRRFQPQFGLRNDRIFGKNAFAKLSSVYNSVMKQMPMKVETSYPGYVLRNGSSGDPVRFIQSYLNHAGGSVPQQTVDGLFGNNTQSAVVVFQSEHGLQADGLVGKDTWDALVQVFNANLM